MIHFFPLSIPLPYSFYSLVHCNQTKQWNGNDPFLSLVHSITLFILFSRPFHYLVYSILSSIPLPLTKQTLIYYHKFSFQCKGNYLKFTKEPSNRLYLLKLYKTLDMISDFIIHIARWCKLKALPGAYRLIKHLRGHGVQMALASNSPRDSIEKKIGYHPTWKESFAAIIAGDEVKAGKPSPEIFLEAAKRLSIDPSKCLVIEDSL
ncbi:putative riboflavin kinase [Helianthus annuus]|nr:putative riboflavin kinase [Helianthus annuus]